MSEQPIQRKLAAVLYADVAGYSRLTGADEDAPPAALRAGLASLTRAIDGRGGRVNHYAGDAILAEFGSVVACVEMAIDIQRRFAEENEDIPEDQRLLFRIGIHMAEVIDDGGEIYGDGVNIAARLESLADVGGICISGVVAEQVRQRLDVGLEDMGDQQVKNIVQPVRAYKVVADTSSGQPVMAVAVSELPSIAVLPFDNLSGDPEQEYFSDGMTEDIITALSRLKWIFVTARNSTFSYKGQSPDIRDVAKDLGVRYVLEGSVRKAGNKVRITAQLIDGSSGNHLWAERYDRDLEDIFALQDEITETVVGAIQPELTDAEIKRARAKPPESLDAWDLYQRGMYHYYIHSGDDMLEAARLFRQAIALDPNLVAPYSGLAQVLFIVNMGQYAENRTELRAEALEMARKAVALDRDDVNAHANLGRALLSVAQIDGNFDAAFAANEHATHLNPSSAYAHYTFGRALEVAGRSEDAIEHLQTAMRLSPRDQYAGQAMAGIAGAYFDLGEFEVSLEWAVKAERSNPNLTWPGLYLTRVATYVLLERLEDARMERDALLARHPQASLAAYHSDCSGFARCGTVTDAVRKVDFPE